MSRFRLKPRSAPDPEHPGRLRSAVSGLTWPVRRIWWALEEKVLWRGSDTARTIAGGATWPAERVAWSLRRRVVWPVADAFAGRGRTGQAGLASVLIVAAAAAVFAGLQLSSSDSTENPPAVQVAQVTPAPEPQPLVSVIEPKPRPVTEPEPVLRGAAPSFEPAEPTPGPDEQDASSDAGPANPAPQASEPGADEDPEDSEADDEAKTIENVQVPLRVARRFAKAFVRYEVGEDVAEAREVFRETAAPDLARALADRPPRQPAAVEVPKAKVLNIVPGPLDSEVLPVSVSLLRLGATSELRLDLELKKNGDWLVGDVRG